MDAAPELTNTCLDEAETEALGVRLSRALSAGDMLTLSGPLGVGKSHLSRAIIRSILDDPLAEVPSPSYTLVNVYQAGVVEIWHADLYRLGDPSELAEIGLEDALESALVLVEWPDRWPDLPPRRLDLTLSFAVDDTRLITAEAHGSDWERALGVLRTTS